MSEQDFEIKVATVQTLSSSGEGICKTVGKVCFIPLTLPEEEIEYKLTKEFANYSNGECVSIIKKSKNRVEPMCPVFGKCGGCDIEHLKYSEQLKFKTQKVAEALTKLGGLKNINVKECVPSSTDYEYRNKVEMPVRFIDGQLLIGFFASGSHNVVTNKYCHLQSKSINDCLVLIKKHLLSSPNLYKNVKHIVVREIEKKLLITIVASEKLELKALNAKLIKNYDDKYGLFVNINSKITPEIFGRQFIHIGGLHEIKTEQQGVSIFVGPHSFFQVNDSIRTKIYGDILNSIQNLNITTVIDAYSGAGLLSGIIAKSAKEVYGIEIVHEAVDNANRLVAKNKLNNLLNICGKCEEELPELLNTLKDNLNTVIILDPPRNGCEKSVMEAVANSNTNQILYLSCEPSTLARDLKVLFENSDKYKITSIQPYDMFPQTQHVECLVCLEKTN